LIELLLCVGLIAVIAALALPYYSAADSSRDARDRRNAQTFCTICSVVQAAGMSVVGEGNEKVHVLQTLRDGVTVESGPLRGKRFSVPNVPDDEIVAASRFVKIVNGELVYEAQEDSDG
jgi:hypothetical protein